MKPSRSLASIEPEKILLIKPSAIGDVVHTLPILNLLRRRWPKAHITWMLTPLCAELLQNNPQLDDIVLFHRRQLGRGWRDPQATAGLWKFTTGLRKRKFDLVVDLQGLFRSGYLAWRSGAPVRVGFAEAREGATLFYTHRVPDAAGERDPLRKGHRHAVERYLDLAAALGCGRGPVEFPLYLTDAEKQWATQVTADIQPFALLIPGSVWPTKRWPAQRFADLALQLRAMHGLKIVTAGSENERELAEQINPDLNLAGQTNLRQLIALINAAKIVIANDSGPMHIAVALQRPLVTLFGPTNPELTGPYGRLDHVARLNIPCSPCFSRKCSHISCLNLLSTEPVAEMAREQLAR